MNMPLSPLSPQNSESVHRAQRQGKFDKRLFEILDQRPSESKTDALINLLRKGVSINAVDNRGWTPLHSAVYTKDVDIVKLLINNDNVDVNIVNNHGRTPLHLAALMGYAEITKLLLDTGKVKTDIKDRDGMTPLDWAEFYNHAEAAYWIRKYVKENTSG